MALTRKDHWAERHFHAFLFARATVPYAWGLNDCATFAADGILTITGVDIMPEFRGYTTREEALHRIRQVSGGGLAEAIESCARNHGLVERKHPLTAQRGDLVLYLNGKQPVAGLVHLNGRDVVSPGEDGLLRTSITSVQRAWSY